MRKNGSDPELTRPFISAWYAPISERIGAHRKNAVASGDATLPAFRTLDPAPSLVHRLAYSSDAVAFKMAAGSALCTHFSPGVRNAG